METTKEQIITALDNLIEAMGKSAEAHKEEGEKENLWRTAKDNFHAFLNRVFDMGGINALVREMTVSSIPMEIEQSEKTSLILELYKAHNALQDAKSKRETAHWKTQGLKQTVIKILGYRKSIKYKDYIFQVYSAGYYGEQGLNIQDADIKEIK